MRKVLFLLSGLAVGFAVCLSYYSIFSPSSAQKVVRAQWEYASIKSVYTLSPAYDKLNRIFGVAEICYLQQATGCRRQEVKHELDYGEFLQERALPENFASRKRASLSASETAFQKALAQMGIDGWEIISDPNLNFEFVNIDEYNKLESKSHLFERENTRAVYFKRLKAQ
jgi:hypothetical protein